jgi:hypothetical protein
MDVLGLVRQDHRRLEALLERCERTDHDDAEERTVLLATLLTALEALLDDAALLDLGRRLENRKHVVAAQEALKTTTTDLLRRPRLRLKVTLAATATLAAITFEISRRRRAKGP